MNSLSVTAYVAPNKSRGKKGKAACERELSVLLCPDICWAGWARRILSYLEKDKYQRDYQNFLF